MHDKEQFALITVIYDKNNLLNKESADWKIGPFKQIYWGMFLSDDVVKKIQEISKSAKEQGYKILSTRKVYSGKTQ
jgi:hypothetical protein